MKMAKRVNWWLLFGFVCLSLLFTIQNVNSPISKNFAYSDYSVYQYVALIMSEGGMPYRDTFDHKGPIFYLINELGYKISPRYGMWIIDLLLMFGTIVYAYKISNKVLTDKMSFFIMTAVLSGIPAWGYWIGNTPEFCFLFFLMITMYNYLEYVNHQDLSYKQILTVGFSSALALLIKPTFLAMFFILIVDILFQTIKKKDFVFLKKCLIWFLIPFLGITAIIALWLSFNGALGECISQYILFNVRYSSAVQESKLTIARIFAEIPPTLFGIIGVCINLMRWNNYTDRAKHILIGIYAAWITVFYISVMPGRDYLQYTIMYYPMLLVVVIYALKDVDKLFRHEENERFIGIIIVLLIAGNILLPNVKNMESNIRNNMAERKEWIEVINFFKDNPGEYEITVVTPDDNWIYLQTGHHSATKYSYTQADLIYESIETDFLKEYTSSINENRPKYIIEHCIRTLYSEKISGNIQLKYNEVFRNNQYIIYKLNEN